MEACSHCWINPTELPFFRAPYVPIVGPGRHHMKPDTSYICRNCGDSITTEEEEDVSTMTVHCAKCHYQWDLPMKIPIPVTRFVAAAKGFSAAGCPQCGAHGKDVIICGPAPKKEATA